MAASDQRDKKGDSGTVPIALPGAGRDAGIGGGPVGAVPPGFTFGKYRVVRQLGSGGMGVVYEATHLYMGKAVALKVLSGARAGDARARARFLREAAAASKLTHPHLVSATDYGTQDGVPYLVMELLSGEDLASYLDRHPAGLPLEEAAAILLAVCAGVFAGPSGRRGPPRPQAAQHIPGHQCLAGDRAQGAGLRDLTPGKPPGNTSLTESVLLGTIPYLSPEQLCDGNVGGQTDQYALGVVLYECVTGRRPHDGQTSYVIMRNIGAGKFARPTLLRPDLPRALDEVILRAMAVNPAERFPSVHALGAALLPFASPRKRVIWAKYFSTQDRAIASGEDLHATRARWRIRHKRHRAPAARGVVSPEAFAFTQVEDLLQPEVWARRRSRKRRRYLAAGLLGLAGLSVAAVIALELARSRSEDAAEVARLPPRPVHRIWAASGCSSDMVRVADRFCVDRFEASTVDDVAERPLSAFYPPSAPLARALFDLWTARLATGPPGGMVLPQLDGWQRENSWRPRAVSRLGVVPQGYVNRLLAAEACASAGKRLCTAEEWRTACRGEPGADFPYGPTYEAGACNIARPGHPALLLYGSTSWELDDPRLNHMGFEGKPLLLPTGAAERCRSVWGEDAVYDMVGNLDEWIVDADGTFLGGFYSRDTREGCGARIDKHAPDYLNYSLGFRCCDNLRPWTP